MSTNQIRKHFPALDRIHNGYPVAYFDGPGGTQVPRTVVVAMNDYFYRHNANTHWAYPTSEETDAEEGETWENESVIQEGHIRLDAAAAEEAIDDEIEE